MTILYHEKQESALCGQHCLNNLLQGPYFNAGALADIAHELDRKEQALMMSEGMTADAMAFMREASGNVDEQGNFSIQVLSEALKRSFGLELSDVTLRGGKGRVLALDVRVLALKMCAWGRWRWCT